MCSVLEHLQLFCNCKSCQITSDLFSSHMGVVPKFNDFSEQQSKLKLEGDKHKISTIIVTVFQCIIVWLKWVHDNIA